MESNESYAEAKQPSDWLDNPGNCFMWNPAAGILLAATETTAPNGETQWEIEACLVGQDEVSSLAAAPRTDGMTWMDVVQSGGGRHMVHLITRQGAAALLSGPGWIMCAEQGRFDDGLTLAAAIVLSKQKWWTGSTGSNDSNDENVYRQEPERLVSERWIPRETEPDPEPWVPLLGPPNESEHCGEVGYYSDNYPEFDGTRGRGCESADLELC